MTVTIEGDTHKGTSGYVDNKAETPPYAFRVVFIVPLARMEQFLGIHSAYIRDFKKKVKACVSAQR